MSQSKPRVGLTDDLFGSRGKPMFGWDALSLFEEAGIEWVRLPPDNLRLAPEAASDFDALFIGSVRVDAASLARDTGRLRIIARNGVGFDLVDQQALNEKGILLTNTPIAVREPVATAALAFILVLSLRLPLKSRIAREARWSERVNIPGIGLPGRTVGIVGLGGIGLELVRLLQPFGMTILGADPFLTQDRLADQSVRMTALDDLLAQSDFVVLTCPLTKDTFHLMDARRLSLMKRSAYLVNVARGPIVDEAALIDALRSEAIAGGGLDVFETEPIDPANPLLAMENVVVTPHSLCWTDTFLDGVARSAFNDIIAACQGRFPTHIVNRLATRHGRVAQWLK